MAWLGNVGAAQEQYIAYDQYGELGQVTTYGGCSNVVSDTMQGTYLSLCSTGTITGPYTYDAVGNRTDLGATYGAGNRLAQFHGGVYTYDADGNVIEKSGVEPTPHAQRFVWNAESRLESVAFDGWQTVRYAYNALGQPVQKYRNDVLHRLWLWAGDQVLAQLDSVNQRVSDFQYAGPDAPYAVTLGATVPTAVQYPEQDVLGNVLGTHTDGVVSETITYDPWGVPTYSGDLHNPLMWKGLLYEGGPAQGDVVGLYDMRGRWYDPQAGRFVQEDPIHAGVNDYTFAADDPINGWDPSGLCSQSQIIAVQDGNGNTVPGCPDGSAPTFDSNPPALPPVTVTAPWPFATPRESGTNANASARGSGFEQGLGWGSVAAGGAEAGGTGVAVGSNFKLYVRTATGGLFRGNQFVSVAKVSEVGKVGGYVFFFGGAVYDAYRVSQGEETLAKGLLNTGAGIAALSLGGPGGALLGSTYFLVDQYVPGGWPGLLSNGPHDCRYALGKGIPCP